MNSGEQIQVEFLIDEETFQRVILPFVENLKRLGIDARVRLVDSTEMKRRQDNFDFDIVLECLTVRSPGNEQRYFWGSRVINPQPEHHRHQNPAVDALVDRSFCADRDALTAACRALDRAAVERLWFRMALGRRPDRLLNKFGARRCPRSPRLSGCLVVRCRLPRSSAEMRIVQLLQCRIALRGANQ
jgi:hypothetical protein